MASTSHIRLAVARCLVVDDEPHVRKVLSRELSTSFDVIAVATVAEATQTMRQIPSITVVVSDYQLEDGDGAQVLREAMTVLPRAVRIMVSGGLDPMAGRALETSGLAHRYVQKPWGFGAVVEAATQLLERRAQAAG